MSNIFLILAQTPSRNLSEFGPIPFLRCSKGTIIRHQIKTIKSCYPEAHIHLVCGGKHNRKLNCKTLILAYKEGNNQSDLLYSCLRNIDDANVWIINGDIVFGKSSLKIPNNRIPYVFVDTKDNIKSTKVGLNHSDNLLMNMEYGLDEKWNQIFYLPAIHVQHFRDCCKHGLFTYEVINEFSKLIDVGVYKCNQSSVFEIDSKEQLI